MESAILNTKTLYDQFVEDQETNEIELIKENCSIDFQSTITDASENEIIGTVT
jgi:hypothetical protein